MNGCMSSIYLRMCNQELCRMGARRRGYEFFVVVTCDFFLDLWALLVVMDVSAPRFSGWLCPGGGCRNGRAISVVSRPTDDPFSSSTDPFLQVQMCCRASIR